MQNLPEYKIRQEYWDLSQGNHKSLALLYKQNNSLIDHEIEILCLIDYICHTPKEQIQDLANVGYVMQFISNESQQLAKANNKEEEYYIAILLQDYFPDINHQQKFLDLIDLYEQLERPVIHEYKTASPEQRENMPISSNIKNILNKYI